VIFFEDLQHAEVREAARKAATESESNPWPGR